jgi:hypothetical protein
VSHTLVAKITIAAMVAMEVAAEYVVCEMCSEAEEIVPMVTVFWWSRSRSLLQPVIRPASEQ